MAATKRDYIPALNQSWLTPLYDPLLRFIMREEVFKQCLIDQASPKAGEQVLDLGCGTGTLTIMLQKAQPGAEVTGVDIDPRILEIARKKAEQEGMQAVRWDQGRADQLPYPDSSFDLVVSSMMLHHLTPETKRRAIREVYRVLKPGGRFHIVDFGPPHSPWAWFMARWMSLFEQTADNFKGQIPVYLKDAGFKDVAERDHLLSLFGPLSLVQAVRPI